MTSAPANFAGRFTPFRTRANSVTTLGRRTLGNTSGAANNWAGMTVDVDRGIVFVPTGSAAFDFYGADRVGDDLFANCLIALDAETGERIWHFQGVHHDLWDRDFPSPPVLLTVQHNGKRVDAVAQTTKQGFVYLFDRTNGDPLFPIDSRDYPPSTVPGEVAAAEAACLPSKPAPFARQLLTEDHAHQSHAGSPPVGASINSEPFRSEGQFVPFSVGIDTVIFPGFDGAAEWGGPAVDPETAILYVNFQRNGVARSPREKHWRRTPRKRPT